MNTQELAAYNAQQRADGAPVAGGACAPGAAPKCGAEETVDSFWHTHPNFEDFSPADMDLANNMRKPFYMTRRETAGRNKMRYKTDRWDPSPEPYRRNGENDTSGSYCECIDEIN